MHERVSMKGLFRNELAIPVSIALFQLVLQTTFHINYGYFRDELYYIACTDHLDFGYVDQPPFSIILLWMSRMLLGDSLHAIRILPSVAGTAVIILAALMCRQLGGKKFAQGLTSLAVIAAPVLLGHGRYFSMNPFDVLFWAAAGYVVMVILGSEKPKLWILFGVIIGLGLLNKYSIGFLIIGLVAGLLLTSQRKQIATAWFWYGASVAALIFLPHVLWQFANDFPSLEFMRNASQQKNINLSVWDFFLGQLRDVNFANSPLWIAGIYFFYSHAESRYRPFGWMYPVIFILMAGTNAKVYYLAPIYPFFLASGAVLFERWTGEQTWNWMKPTYVGLVILLAIITLPFALPVLPVERFIEYQKLLGLSPRAEERHSLGELPQHYADQFGWEEMVSTVASIYKKLTPEEQSQVVIYVRNYGEAAAIDFFGERYGLPKALCGHNSYWLWGPAKRTGNIAIIFGTSRDLEESLVDLHGVYSEVQLAGITNATHAIPFENGRLIFVCKGMNTTFQKIWPGEQLYI